MSKITAEAPYVCTHMFVCMFRKGDLLASKTKLHYNNLHENV